MEKKVLFDKGYLTFNLKEYNENFYNQLRELIPHKGTEVLEDLMDSFLFCGELKMSISDFYDKFEELAKDSGFIFDNIYEKHKNISLERAQSGSRYLSTYFHNNDIKVLRKVKDIIFNNFEFEQNQSWYNGHLHLQRRDLHDLSIDIMSSIIGNYYDVNLDDYFGEGSVKIDVSAFPKGSLITDHQDGQNSKRVAVILIYLNDEWESNYGGQLKLDSEFILEPIFGNVAVLDFTQNNVHHEVLELLNGDLERWAFISFIENRKQ